MELVPRKATNLDAFDVHVPRSHKLRLVLVTGAPRSGTTPVGAALALAPGARMIYEPMGPTGDRRIPVGFAIPGQAGLSVDVFRDFLDDLKALRLDLKPQKRRSHANMIFSQRLIRSIIGSRTRLTYWTAKLAPNFATLVWKDPMAAFAVPSVLSHGIPTVICIRSPLAHAASFKRKGWTADIASIYPHFRDCYGAVPEIERLIAADQKPKSVASASMLWHLVYLLAYRTSCGEFGRFSVPLLLISGTELEANEMQVYCRMYENLGLPFEGRPRRWLEGRAGQAVEDSGGATRTHDWRRSILATNSYWKHTLTDEEVEFVHKLNSRIFQKLETIQASGSASPQNEVPIKQEDRLR